MADNCSRGTAQRQPCSRYFGIDGHIRQIETWNDAGGDYSLAGIDDYNAKREPPALSAERVRATRVAASHGSNINSATKSTDDHRAHDRADEITEKKFDAKFQHLAKPVLLRSKPAL